MLYAVIRWERDALHFFGDVTPYNLETLRLHVRARADDGGVPDVRFELDPHDRPAFRAHAAKWLATLRRNGSAVEVVVTGAPQCLTPRAQSPALAAPSVVRSGA